MKKILILSLVIVGALSFLPAYAATKDDFSNAILRFKEENNSFQRARSDFENGNINASAVVAKGRSFLLKTVDVLQKRDEQLLERVNSKNEIYNSVRNTLDSQISADMKKLEEVRAKINKSSSTSELKLIASEILDYKQDNQETVRRLVALANIGQFENSIIKVSENRSQKIEVLKQEGKNVEELEKLLAQANAKITEAQRNIYLLKENLAREVGEINLSDVQKKINEIKDIIKVAYDIFKEIAFKGNEIFSSSSELDKESSSSSNE